MICLGVVRRFSAVPGGAARGEVFAVVAGFPRWSLLSKVLRFISSTMTSRENHVKSNLPIETLAAWRRHSRHGRSHDRRFHRPCVGRPAACRAVAVPKSDNRGRQRCGRRIPPCFEATVHLVRDCRVLLSILPRTKAEIKSPGDHPPGLSSCSTDNGPFERNIQSRRDF